MKEQGGMDGQAGGLTEKEAGERLARFGYNEVPEKRPSKLIRFARKFWGITPWMLEATIILTYAIGKYYDTAMVAFLLVFNAVLGFHQEDRANAALEYLKKRLSVEARVIRSGSWVLLPSRELVPGDVVRLRAGDLVPADVRVVEGKAESDQSALTGESFIVDKGPGEILYSGSIVRRGEVTGEVAATGTHTYFGKTVELVRIAKPKLHMEEVTSNVVKWMLAMVFILLFVAGSFALFKGMDIFLLIPLAVILLISTIPIALPTMFIVSTALGSLELAKKGVLVTRLNAIEDASTMDILCVDKTGTITMNRLSVTETMPAEGYSGQDVALYGALASQEANRDPIDMAFLDAADEQIKSYHMVRFSPFDPATRRTEAVVEHGGHQLFVMKGALNTILPLCRDPQPLLDRISAEAEGRVNAKGYRAIAVAKGDHADTMGLVGIAFLFDSPRQDSPTLIKELKSLGIDVKMLTGDALPIARDTASRVGIGEIVMDAHDFKRMEESGRMIEEVEKSDGFAEVYPEGKYLIVKSLQKGRHIVGMTGDGINDAPALKQAEVGIAVSDATDVAKKAAGVVLTHEGLGGIVDLVENGRMIYRRIITWILNKIVKTFQVMVFVIFAFILTGQYVVSIFSMVLLLFLTDFVTLSLSTDNVKYGKKPENWDLSGLVRVAIPLGILIMFESLALLYAGFHWFGMGSSPDRLYTYTFDMLMFLSLFDVLIVREKGHFWESRPSTVLLLSIIADAILVFVISITGLPGLASIEPYTALFILVSSLILTFGINDLAKVFLARIFWKES